MRSEKTRQSHATMDAAKALAVAAAASGAVQAALQTARERTYALAQTTEEAVRLRQETERLSQLATEVGVGLSSLAAAAEVQAWQLARAGQEEELNAKAASKP